MWFFSRASGTQTGPLNFGKPIAPTGKRVQSPPQAQSMLFDESARVYTLTVGYLVRVRVRVRVRAIPALLCIPRGGRRADSPDDVRSFHPEQVGYCMDKRIGNTEGLGGVFALLKGIGKPLPFPEAQRLYTPSLRFEAFERIAKVGESLGYGPNAPRPPSPKEIL